MKQEKSFAYGFAKSQFQNGIRYSNNYKPFSTSWYQYRNGWNAAEREAEEAAKS